MSWLENLHTFYIYYYMCVCVVYTKKSFIFEWFTHNNRLGKQIAEVMVFDNSCFWTKIVQFTKWCIRFVVYEINLKIFSFCKYHVHFEIIAVDWTDFDGGSPLLEMLWNTNIIIWQEIKYSHSNSPLQLYFLLLFFCS